MNWRARLGLVGLFLCLAGTVQAQPKKDQDPLSWDRSIGGIVERYCVGCHNAEKARGGLNLKQDENPALIRKRREVWLRALEQIQSGEMPPEDSRQPSKEQRELLIQFLEATLQDVDCASMTEPGPPLLRRLNRFEYDLAVRDLTGLPLSPGEDFPPDASAYGFDNNAEALTLDPSQVDRYYEAALGIVRAMREQKKVAPATHAAFFGPDKPDREKVANMIRSFSTRAFRRPVEESWVTRCLGIYDKAVEQKLSHEAALGHVYSAVLISPRFLNRVEEPHLETGKPYPVDDWELASRLSFFLWSRPPDAELLEKAGKKELTGSTGVLESEVRRMIQDPRSDALVDRFFGRWLGFHEVVNHRPDAETFPTFNEELRRAMHEEIRMMVRAYVRGGEPIRELVDGRSVYVNEVLARHYGMKNVHGKAMRKLPSPSRERGGVLTTAALLMVQSDPTRPNIPRRGSFVVGRLLGEVIPPPPPNVPELEAAGANAGRSLTIPEMLELHRKSPDCSGCHGRIDPYGLVLEGFDAIGAARRQGLDDLGTLENGRQLVGPAGLKDLMVERQADFTRALARNLMIYALGRAPIPSDECVLEAMLKSAGEGDGQFESLILPLVRSAPFLLRRNPE